MEKIVWLTNQETFRGATTGCGYTFFVRNNEVFIQSEDINMLLDIVEYQNSASSRDYIDISMAKISDDILPCYFESKLDNIKLHEEKIADNEIVITLNKALTKEQIEIVKKEFDRSIIKVHTHTNLNGETFVTNNIISYKECDTDSFLVKNKQDKKYYHKNLYSVA